MWVGDGVVRGDVGGGVGGHMDVAPHTCYRIWNMRMMHNVLDAKTLRVRVGARGPCG